MHKYKTRRKWKSSNAIEAVMCHFRGCEEGVLAHVFQRETQAGVILDVVTNKIYVVVLHLLC